MLVISILMCIQYAIAREISDNIIDLIVIIQVLF